MARGRQSQTSATFNSPPRACTSGNRGQTTLPPDRQPGPHVPAIQDWNSPSPAFSPAARVARARETSNVVLGTAPALTHPRTVGKPAWSGSGAWCVSAPGTDCGPPTPSRKATEALSLRQTGNRVLPAARASPDRHRRGAADGTGRFPDGNPCTGSPAPRQGRQGCPAAAPAERGERRGRERRRCHLTPIPVTRHGRAPRAPSGRADTADGLGPSSGWFPSPSPGSKSTRWLISAIWLGTVSTIPASSRPRCTICWCCCCDAVAL